MKTCHPHSKQVYAAKKKNSKSHAGWNVERFKSKYLYHLVKLDFKSVFLNYIVLKMNSCLEDDLKMTLEDMKKYKTIYLVFFPFLLLHWSSSLLTYN